MPRRSNSWFLPVLFGLGAVTVLLMSVVAANVSSSTFDPADSYGAVLMSVGVFALFAVIYFMLGARGYRLSNRVGIVQACVLTVGVHAYLAADFWFAVDGAALDGSTVDRFAVYNPLVTVGIFVMALSVLPFWWQFSKVRGAR